jgi:hypothetical protein
MSTIAFGGRALPALRLATAGEFIREMRRRQPLLYGTAAVMTLMMAPTLAALLIDTRTVNGVNVWLKPLKFELSLAVFFGTLAWFWECLPAELQQSRFLRGFALASVVAVAYEMVYMIAQSGRGVGSHFNTATPLEGMLFTLMGLAALVFTALPLVLGIAIARSLAPGVSPGWRLSVILGLVLTFILGATAGIAMSVNGGHWVGTAWSDAGGLPLFGWSRDGGDLRVAHFFGIHAMQIVPFAGWLITRRQPDATAGVWLAALALVGVTVFTLAEALAGRPFLAFL